MKIENGYITNSSSTSFIISSTNGLTKEIFFKLLGVSDESLLVEMYNDLYKAIKASIRIIPQGVSIRKFFKEKGIEINCESDVAEIERRYKEGETVYWGDLRNSGDNGEMAEAFFAHESFIVVNDDLYFNARNSVY